MKPTNEIKRHHYKSDCQIIEQFYSFDDGTAVQVPVPERIKIEYYIDKGKGSIVVERKGDYCHNCSVSDDGMTLIAAIPLAKHPIGRGRLLCDKVEYIDDPLFPGGYKVKVTPMLTSIELWSQASDNDKSSAYGELLLAKIIRGKDGVGVPAGGSAGQMLSKRSDEDYDTEWVDAPQGGGDTVDIVDNLTTADPTKTLSANMGRTLNEKFQYKNYLAGKNLDQTGNILDAVGWNVTTPIAVVGGTALTFECGGQNTSALCEYDANDNFLDYWGQNSHPRTITTKANTAYVRLAVPNRPTQDYFVAQNDVVLFNKLHDFDIVEQVAENTQKLENIGDSVEVKVENITDANGKPLSEILSEISAGGGEGVLLYNAEQTLTDEQKSQVAKNIGQPRERLILEWKNDQAEVLQPTAYDAETGYFTVETMPSWLAEDGAEASGIINYAGDTLLRNIDFKYIPLPAGNEGTLFKVKRVSEHQIELYEPSQEVKLAAIPDEVRCDGFYFTNSFNISVFIEKSEGIKHYRIYINRAAMRPSRYKNLAIEGLVRDGGGCKWGDCGLGYTTHKHYDTNTIVDFSINWDNATYKFNKIECSGGERTNATGGVQAFVNPTLYSLDWQTMWGYEMGNHTGAYFNTQKNFINKYTTIELYEITE